MKQTKRLIALLLTAALLAMTPLTALALGPAGYVPTKTVTYDKVDGKWVQLSETTSSYKSDGRVTKKITKYTDGTTYTTKYTWGGDRVKKVVYPSGTYSYKFKGKKLVSFTVNTDSKKTYKLKWKGKNGTYKSGTSTETYTIDGKGRFVKEKLVLADGTTYISSYKYYSNGNLKSYSWKGNGTSVTEKYNSKGWITSVVQKGSTPYTAKYTYTKKKGKVISQLCKWEFDKTSSGETKAVYKKWKKVRHVRNVDGFGFTLPLG